MHTCIAVLEERSSMRPARKLIKDASSRFPLPFPRLFEVGRLIIGVWKMRGGCLVFVGDVDRSSGTICLDNVEM